jgi:hypothetical protein
VSLHGELADELGVTAPTIFRWCRDGLLPDQPAHAGSGRHRDYTARDWAVARGLAVMARGTVAFSSGPFRQRIGQAIRDAALVGLTSASVELTPGYTITVSWDQNGQESR